MFARVPLEVVGDAPERKSAVDAGRLVRDHVLTGIPQTHYATASNVVVFLEIVHHFANATTAGLVVVSAKAPLILILWIGEHREGNEPAVLREFNIVDRFGRRKQLVHLPFRPIAQKGSRNGKRGELPNALVDLVGHNRMGHVLLVAQIPYAAVDERLV